MNENFCNPLCAYCEHAWQFRSGKTSLVRASMYIFVTVLLTCLQENAVNAIETCWGSFAARRSHDLGTKMTDIYRLEWMKPWRVFCVFRYLQRVKSWSSSLMNFMSILRCWPVFTGLKFAIARTWVCLDRGKQRVNTRHSHQAAR